MILPFMPGMIISRLYDLELGGQIDLSIFNVCEFYNIVGGVKILFICLKLWCYIAAGS